MIRALNELALVIQQGQSKAKEFLEVGYAGNLPLQQFYEGLVNQTYSSDSDAASVLLEVEPSDARYQRLKREMMHLLLRSTFFLDLQDFNDRQRAYYEVHTLWAAAKILLGKNALEIGLYLCKRVLRYSTKFEFTEITVEVLRNLRLHYATKEGNAKLFEEFNEQYKYYFAIYQAENLAEELYADLVLNFVNSRADDTLSKKQSLAASEQLRPLLEQYPDSYRLPLCAMLIEMNGYLTVIEQEQAIAASQRYLAYFQRKPYEAIVPLQVLYYQQLISYTMLRDYSAGQRVVVDVLNNLEDGSFNWFKVQELFFILAMHTGQYQEALSVFQAVTQHRRFSFLPASNQEIWQIFKAYLSFLQAAGYLQDVQDDDAVQFRLGKFMNETPIFSKDRRGMNIPILIAQLLHWVSQGKTSKVIDRIDALEKYCSRYLTKDTTFRSNCFIKMVMQLPAGNFHLVAVGRKAAKYVSRLEEAPIDLKSQTYEVEILPYDTLWGMVVDVLVQNQRRTG